MTVLSYTDPYPMLHGVSRTCFYHLLSKHVHLFPYFLLSFIHNHFLIRLIFTLANYFSA